MFKKHDALTLFACLMLAACDGVMGQEDVAEEESGPTVTAASLYNEARADLDAENYTAAIAGFEEVERQFPYSDLSVRAQVMSGYTAYQAAEYEQSAAILERYVRLHPADSSVPYAYYLIALGWYEQISDVGRDQKMTENALEALTDVVRRFPATDYARDAKLKLDLVYDHLAGKEMQVGRYYLGRDEYLAAINRFKYVVENHQTTTHIPEALHRLVESYLQMGIEVEAKRYAAVLGHNYPKSIWYRDSYRLLTGEVPASVDEEKSWLGF